MAILSKICQAPNCNNPRDLKQRSSLCVMHRVRRSRYKSYNLPNDDTNSLDTLKPFEEINRNTKAKGKICSISNCITKVYKHGTICSKHRWRKKKWDYYDLPDYNGEPNIPIIKKLPEGCVSICKIHGDLKKEQTYIRYYKGKESSYYCKECLIGFNIKNKYKGLNNLDDYDRMLKDQDGKCGMCKTDKNNTTRNGKIKRFNIDHCHKTGKVRKLLCSFCNSLLGYAKDSIETLESAILYLKSHQG